MKDKQRTLKEKLAKARRNRWWRKGWLCGGLIVVFLLGICVSSAVNRSELKSLNSTLDMMRGSIETLESQRDALASENEQLTHDKEVLIERLTAKIRQTAKTNDASELSEAAEAKEPEAVTLEATTSPTEEEKREDLARRRALNEAATETYTYSSLAKVPAELPADCGRLKFALSDTGKSGTRVLAEFTHPAMGYKFTVVENPDLGAITLKNRNEGNNMVAVFCQNQDESKAELMVMAFNPVEAPVVTIYMNAWNDVVNASIDLPVFYLSFYSRTKLGDHIYQSDGGSEYNYAWWGHGGGGDTNYEFSPTYVKVLANSTYKSLIDDSVENLLDYENYWKTNSDKILNLRRYFSSDRSVFDMDGYAAHLGYDCTYATDGHRIYEKGDRKIEIKVVQQSGGVAKTTITIGGEEVWYAGFYNVRISGVPDTVKVSGNIVLSQRYDEQLDIVIGFLEEARM